MDRKRTWLIVKLLFNLGLFIGYGISGIRAVLQHVDAGWFAGFIFCSAGTWLFGQADHGKGLVEQVFGSADEAQ